MTEPRFDGKKLRELLAKATPGPWDWYAADESMVSLVNGDEIMGNYVLSCTRCDACRKGGKGRCTWPKPEDRDLISAMRDALPGLLDAAAERDRLREEIKRLRRSRT